MGFFEILLIGVGLSMDAFAISAGNAMAHREKTARLFEMALWFGVFQGLMPVIGYSVGAAFSDVVTRLGGVLVMFILCFIGGKMLYDGISSKGEETTCCELTHRLLFVQAVATSIDALAVGVGLRAESVEIYSASLLIAATTFVLSLVAAVIGRRFGDVMGNKAAIFGGVLLIAIGIKSVIG